MAEGGFLVKFDAKEVARCYAVAFDYDEWQCETKILKNKT